MENVQSAHCQISGGGLRRSFSHGLKRIYTWIEARESIGERIRQQIQLVGEIWLRLGEYTRKEGPEIFKGLNEPLHGLAMTHIPMRATFERLVDMALMH